MKFQPCKLLILITIRPITTSFHLFLRAVKSHLATFMFGAGIIHLSVNSRTVQGTVALLFIVVQCQTVTQTLIHPCMQLTISIQYNKSDNNQHHI